MASLSGTVTPLAKKKVKITLDNSSSDAASYDSWTWSSGGTSTIVPSSFQISRGILIYGKKHSIMGEFIPEAAQQFWWSCGHGWGEACFILW